MSFLDCDRFHKAARDGFLDLIQEANRKELNSRDEDGMTPAMWAAYYGHLDALRLIVGRGGDPDKCDHYGNTCLHCASGNGHADCVSFLVNFGVNLWALDNDFHTAKDVAVLNRRDDCLRLLDHAHSKHALVNKKLVQRLKEKSVYDAEKRVKSYRKMQQKAAKRAEKEEKERCAARKDRSADAPKFSEIVNNSADRKEPLSKRLSAERGRTTTKKSVVFLPGDIIRRRDDDEEEDDRSTSSPSDDAGSDVLHAATDSGIDLQDSSSSPPSSSLRHSSLVDSLRHPPSLLKDYNGVVELSSSSSPFGVPSSSLRHSSLKDYKDSLRHSSLKDSIGSAGSLARRHIRWEDEYEVDDDDADDDATDVSDDDEDEGDEEEEEEEVNPLSVVLAAVGLSEYLPLFESERIDLEALSLLTEDDLKTLGMPLGPRRKLDKAVQERRKTMEDPGAVLDSRL